MDNEQNTQSKDFQNNTKQFKLILNFIKSCRVKYGYTQRQLAEILEMHPSTYNLLENGRQIMSLPQFIQILNFFYISLRFDKQNEKFLIQGQNNIVGNNYSKITQDNRQNYAESPDVLRAQITLLDERIKEKDAQIKEKDAQINKLLDIMTK